MGGGGLGKVQVRGSGGDKVRLHWYDKETYNLEHKNNLC